MLAYVKAPTAAGIRGFPGVTNSRRNSTTVSYEDKV